MPASCAARTTVGRLQHDFQCVVEREGAPADARAQGLAVEELHHHVRLAALERARVGRLDDVRVVDVASGRGLAKKALDEGGARVGPSQQNLQRAVVLGDEVLHLVAGAHASCTNPSHAAQLLGDERAWRERIGPHLRCSRYPAARRLARIEVMGADLLGEGAVFASDYRVLRPLSSGGMGSVFVVEQVSTGAQPALASSPRLRERFEQEARVSSRIQSDHVVSVLSAGVDAATNQPTW